jgi:hypothetical protein
LFGSASYYSFNKKNSKYYYLKKEKNHLGSMLVNTKQCWKGVLAGKTFALPAHVVNVATTVNDVNDVVVGPSC